MTDDAKGPPPEMSAPPAGPSDRPSPTPWPPLLAAGGLLVGALLHLVVPWELSRAWLGFGVILALAAAAFEVWAAMTLKRANTNLLPTKPALQLVDAGPFAITRNPIYLGNVVLLFGLGLIIGTGWILIAALLYPFAVTPLAIAREERHLAARFGEAWTAYAARVPRWIGPF